MVWRGYIRKKRTHDETFIEETDSKAKAKIEEDRRLHIQIAAPQEQDNDKTFGLYAKRIEGENDG